MVGSDTDSGEVHDMTPMEKPTPRNKDTYRKPQRAWLRTGSGDFGFTKPKYQNQGYSGRIGNLDRKKAGAQHGFLVVFRLDEASYCLVLGEISSRDDMPEDLLEQGVIHITTPGHWSKALRGRVPDEPLWINSGPGLPRPFGRRVQIIIEEVLQPIPED